MLVAELVAFARASIADYQNTSIINIARAMNVAISNNGSNQSANSMREQISSLKEIILEGELRKKNKNSPLNPLQKKYEKYDAYNIANHLMENFSDLKDPLISNYNLGKLLREIEDFFKKNTDILNYLNYSEENEKYSCRGLFPIEINISLEGIDYDFEKALVINKSFSDLLTEVSMLVMDQKKSPLIVCSATSDWMTVLAHDSKVIGVVLGIVKNLTEIADSVCSIKKAIYELSKLKSQDTVSINERDFITDKVDTSIDHIISELKEGGSIIHDDGRVNEIKVSIRKNSIKIVNAILSGAVICAANESILTDIEVQEDLSIISQICEFNSEILNTISKIGHGLSNFGPIKFLTKDES